MRVLVALAALLVSSGTPDVRNLILQPTQVGTGYQLLTRADGLGVTNTVTLDLCGVKNYPSEKLRTTRLQVNYAAKGIKLGLSNEVVTYKTGGAKQAMREVTQHATHCPTTPVVTGEAGVPPLRFTITRISDSRLLKGYLAVRVRARGTVTANGKTQKVDQISYADLSESRGRSLRHLQLRPEYGRSARLRAPCRGAERPEPGARPQHRLSGRLAPR